MRKNNTMKLLSRSVIVAILCLVMTLSCGPEKSLQKIIDTIPSKHLENYSFDENSSIRERLNSSDQMILDYIRDMDMNPDYLFYDLSEPEISMIDDYFKLLPPYFQKVLKERLIGIYFIENFYSSGLTDFVLSEEGKIYTILFLNPEILGKSISELFTSKDMSCFMRDNDGLSLEINISDDYSGLLYILVHEAAHIVDYVDRKTPYVHNVMKDLGCIREENAPFTEQFWDSYDRPVDFLLISYNEKLNFYTQSADKKISPNDMLSVYQEFQSTPFASLYSYSNWAEDFADYITLYYLTHYLGMNYRIGIFDNGKTLFDYEPFANRTVSDRFYQLDDILN